MVNSFRSMALWVSGSSETKTYGKGVTLREREEQPTLPRKYLFGKDFYNTARIFNYLRTSSVYLQTLFSGKFCTHSHHTVAQNIPIGLRPLSKSSYV